MDMMLRVNHYRRDRLAVRAKPPGQSRTQLGCPFRKIRQTFVSFLSPLSSRRKLILLISAHALNRKQ